MELDKLGVRVNRKRLRRLMEEAGIEAIAPKRWTSMPDIAHRKYPYLLKGLAINRPDQVWCADITYIPMERGHAYLVAVMDWHTRAVEGMDTKVSMDGRGRWLDNVFIERLWRSLKCERLYLSSYRNLVELEVGIAEWMGDYNHERIHQALDYAISWRILSAATRTYRNGLTR